jgi:hypothetical protein
MTPSVKDLVHIHPQVKYPHRTKQLSLPEKKEKKLTCQLVSQTADEASSALRSPGTVNISSAINHSLAYIETIHVILMLRFIRHIHIFPDTGTYWALNKSSDYEPGWESDRSMNL